MDEIKHYCSECSHELTLIKGQYDFHGYCPECFNFEGTIRDNNYCCMKPDLIMVRHTIRDGRFQIKVQCGFCAVSQGPCYPFKSVMDINTLPPSNYELAKEIEKIRLEEIGNMRKIVLKKFEERTGIKTNKEGPLIDYEHYLKSTAWKKKRKLVLERDQHICQSCLSKKAREVHHLTYVHLLNEPLFDLVSVCRDCHQSITDMDKKSEFAKITHLKILTTVFNRNQTS